MELSVYEEHALSRGSSSKAMAYVGITCNGKTYWGAGLNEDIIKASIHALVVAVNKLPQIQSEENGQDDRLISILNYIQSNYKTVTLEDVAVEFHLSEPYISKYIKDKSGKTFWRTRSLQPHEKGESAVKERQYDGRNIALC